MSDRILRSLWKPLGTNPLELQLFMLTCASLSLSCIVGHNRPATTHIVNELAEQIVLPDIATPPPKYHPTAEAYIDGQCSNICMTHGNQSNAP